MQWAIFLYAQVGMNKRFEMSKRLCQFIASLFLLIGGVIFYEFVLAWVFGRSRRLRAAGTVMTNGQCLFTGFRNWLLVLPVPCLLCAWLHGGVGIRASILP